VGTDSGGSASATAIRALLIKLTQAENPKHPDADNPRTSPCGDLRKADAD